MSKGIIIIMSGSFNYGQMALNLALSIKAKAKIPICLLANMGDMCYDYIHICAKQDGYDIKNVFDYKIQIPPEYINNSKVNFSLLKLNLNKLTPFDQTIYIDLDTVINSVNFFEPTWNKLNEVHLLYQTEGYNYKINPNLPIYNNLVPISKYADAFDLDLKRGMPEIHTYLFAFNKDAITDAFFKSCNEIYTRIIGTPELVPAKWYGTVSDEVVIHIALLKSMYLLDLYKGIRYMPLFEYKANSKDINKFQGISFTGDWNINSIDCYERYISFMVKSLKGIRHRPLRFKLSDYFDINFV